MAGYLYCENLPKSVQVKLNIAIVVKKFMENKL